MHGKTGDVIEVQTHPEYVDFPVRDSRSRTSFARLEFAVENFVAPIVAGMNRRTAIDTYPDLTRAAAELAQKHPGREDGKRVLEYLVAWGRPHPQARWHVAGAETVPKHVRFIERATMPRLSATSLTADPLAKGVRFIGEAERMDEMEMDDLGELLGLGPAWDDISGAALLQREVRIQPSGGGSKSKSKKDEGQDTQAERNERTRRMLQEDGNEPSRPVRLAAVVHDVVVAEPSSKIVFEALARAIRNGAPYKSVLDAIEKCQPGGTA